MRHRAPAPVIKRELFYPDSDDDTLPESVTVSTAGESVVVATSEEPSLPNSTPAVEPRYSFKLKHEIELDVLRSGRREKSSRVPRTGIAADGTLIPPPKNDRYGPAAEPPLESCRPGGPRIYDLLNDLPLEPFGILAWSIVDREEEIYELQDVRDEDKVVLALWNRWIFLNR